MEAKIKAGTYRTNITPPLGICLEGSLGKVVAREIKDNLYANSVVFCDGKEKAAVVSVDVCYIPGEIFADIIKEVEASCDIPQNNILIAATHTHLGPTLRDDLLGEYQAWTEYVEVFKRQVVTAICMAAQRIQPVKIGAGKGKNENHVFNRRLKKPDGSIVMNWVNTEFLKDCISEGVTDPELIVLKIEDAYGEPVAFIVNYALHNNANIGGISADLAGQMGDILRKVYGDDLVVLFLAGACGDVNWIDYKSPERNNPGLYKKIGRGLAGSVLEIDAVMEYQDIDCVGIASRKLIIPERPFCEYDGKSDMTFGEAGESEYFFNIYRKARLMFSNRKPAVHELDIHALKLGDNIAIVTNPGEMFTELGIKIKHNSPFKYTMVSELTNGYAGYIPTSQAFKEGGYEVRKLPGNSYLDEAAGEKIVETSLQVLNLLKNKMDYNIRQDKE
ncbi:MAG: neutral/alkaline non-lysosomal ceramidase N-terminal domain-containing protein [Firmicutes bacterium]|nr:neutral/alkaline non-lysosomal ceramidase N-terminal domain-containing protein [Bacillota bacterium]